jgi:hypothetical protein
MRYVANPCVVYFIFGPFRFAECKIIPLFAGDQTEMDLPDLGLPVKQLNFVIVTLSIRIWWIATPRT